MHPPEHAILTTLGEKRRNKKYAHVFFYRKSLGEHLFGTARRRLNLNMHIKNMDLAKRIQMTWFNVQYR